jgi:DNA (cytosine-5)-methyltransferase 1
MLRSLPTRALKVEKINRKKRALRNNNTEQRGIYMPLNNIQSNYNFIDLFAGAGGLSEGFLQAGFNPVAHVEMNEFAAKTLETRSAYYYLKSTNNLGLYKKYLSGKITRDEFVKQIPASITKTVINETMSDDTLPAVFKTIDGIMKIRGISKVDVIVGGPPCQAYSLVGRAQSSHMEVPMAEDPRNYLYKLYARFLKRYQPRMFVFENVIGIESANGGTT